MKIDLEYVKHLARELIEIPSIAGHCDAAIRRVAEEFSKYGIDATETTKGALLGTWTGEDDTRHRVVAAHADTLGGAVRQIMPNGRLKLFPVGFFDWRHFEAENCLVRTLDGKEYRGTLLPIYGSYHAFPDMLKNGPHDAEHMEVRLDADTGSKEATETLGIHNGDPVFFDPRFEEIGGYLKSRFLDDKISVAATLGTIKAMQEQGIKPAHTVHFCISNFEEIGHATPPISPKVVEFASFDIGIVASNTASSERAVTIISHDTRMPYDRRLTRRLTELAERDGIPYRVDAYLHYGSDASVTSSAGQDLRAVCFGPGVDATHHYERTHLDAVDASARLLGAYLTDRLI